MSKKMTNSMYWCFVGKALRSCMIFYSYPIVQKFVTQEAREAFSPGHKYAELFLL